MSTWRLQPIRAGNTVEAPDDVSVTGNTIRSVGSVTPVTTNWNANDVWIDTVTSATPVIRVWSGTAFVPARSSGVSLFSDMFTGTDGATVSTSNWTGGSNPGSGTGYGFTYSSNTGKLTTSTLASSKISRSVNITNPTDANVSFSFKLPSANPASTFICWIRADSAMLGSAGYAVSVYAGKFGVSKYSSFAATDFNPGGTTFNYSPDTWYSVRFRVVGTTVQARVWVTSNAEPSTWVVNTTDSTFTSAGYVGLYVAGDATTNPDSVYIDNFVIDPS